MPLEERRKFLLSLRPFEQKPYERSLVEEECERLVYVYNDYSHEDATLSDGHRSSESNSGGKPGIRHGKFRKEILHLDEAGKDDPWQLLERYTVSNVMSASVQVSLIVLLISSTVTVNSKVSFIELLILFSYLCGNRISRT